MGKTTTEAVYTIVTANYLPQALVWADSVLEKNPGEKVFVFVIDKVPAKVCAKNPQIHFINYEDLAQKDPLLYNLAFKHMPLELICLLKYYFARYLQESLGFKKLLYMDADSQVFSSLRPLFDLLSQHPILITPHILNPNFDVKDGCRPTEETLLCSGMFNTGFLGFTDAEPAKRFLEWILKRLLRECKIDVKNGYFADQIWANYIPVYFPEAHILTHPGVNVAYWNLQERSLKWENGVYTCNDQPLIMFHFSGYRTANPWELSIYQNRYHLQLEPVLRRLFGSYRLLWMSRDIELVKIPPAYFHFDNGVDIPEFVRGLYAKVGRRQENFGNPFSAKAEGSFFNWLLKAPGDFVPAIVLEMRALRKDVIKIHPYPGDARSQINLLEWAESSGAKEFQLSKTWASLLKLVTSTARARRQIKLTRSMEGEAQRPGHEPSSFGVNLGGFFQSEKGVGTAVRSSRCCLKEVGIPFVINNVIDTLSQNQFALSKFDFIETNPFSVNLVHVNPGDLPMLIHRHGVQYFRSRYNIGYWAWEFSDFPGDFQRALDYFDEIWVPSSFLQKALSLKVHVPVICMPHSIDMPEVKIKNSKKEEPFTFLFCFDFASVCERKNPIGLIRAFKKAFKPQEDVRLIIKMSHGYLYGEDLSRVQREGKGDERICLINEILSKEQVLDLMNAADCYISLHRSEGYGLTMLEAMSLGKPVIATAYSGNMDFMDANTSYLVKYELSPLTKSYGPYKAGLVWSEPNLDHAASLMREVFENPDQAREVGLRGMNFVREKYSHKAVARQYSDRLIQVSRRQTKDPYGQ